MILKKEKDYWANYYKSGAAPEEPSNFASYIMGKYLNTGDSLIELGCGNGRDAHFFAENGVKVTALDLCAPEIEKLMETNGQYKNLHYKIGDFTKLEDLAQPLDTIYSRFTLHSVTASGQKDTLEWCFRNLKEGGKLFIETRGQKNEIYMKGEPVSGEKDSYIYEGHYRRFVDFEEFTKEIIDTGFSILEGSEETGFAPFQGTDYHFIRIVAIK